MEKLNIFSYNCRGLPNNCNIMFERPSVVSLLNNPEFHIVCLQETWYSKQDLANINSLHSDFNGTGAATVDFRDSLCYGHRPGGVVILWRSIFNNCIAPIEIKCDWLAGIMCTYENKRHAIICVYMPCMSTQSINDDVFLECLGFLAATIEELDCTCITIIGDWNADVSNDKHQFGNYLNQFCSDIGLIISSELKLPEDSFTYKSDSWHTTSWIDHCVSSKDGHDIIHDMEILYPKSTGDHVPFRVGVSSRVSLH